MNKVILVLIAHLISSHAIAASIGGSEGTGGDKGVSCRRSDGTTVIESLDRYEAVHLFHYQVSASLDFQTELNRMVEKLVSGSDINFGDSIQDCPFCIQHQSSSEQDSQAFLNIVTQFKSRFEFIPDGQHLRTTDDIGRSAPMPDNCSLVQIISFTDGSDGEMADRIQVDQQYWSSLTSQDQAALLVHEFVYRALRGNYSESDSVRVRKIVALLVSKEVYPSQNFPLKELGEVLFCRTSGITQKGDGTAFYVIPSVDGSSLVFDTLMDRAPIVAMTGGSSISYQSWKDGSAQRTEIVPIRSVLDRHEVVLSLKAGGWTLQLPNSHVLPFNCRTQIRF